MAPDKTMVSAGLRCEVKLEDRYEPCFWHGANLAACGVKGAVVAGHGQTGCMAVAAQLRTDQTVDGTFVRVQGSGLSETDVIMGGEGKFKDMLEDITSRAKKPSVVFALCTCAPSMVGDDIEAISKEVSAESGVDIIALDTAGFKGGYVKGGDLVFSSLIKKYAKGAVSKDPMAVNLIAPYLSGSNNWRWDLDEVKTLLGAIGARVNCVMTSNTELNDIKEFAGARYNLYLTSEHLRLTSEASQKLGIEEFGQDLPVPLGMHNTEIWLKQVARRLGAEGEAEKILSDEMGKVIKILRANYNASWILQALSNCHVAIAGPASFAASLARYFYYDLNCIPTLLALYGETEEALRRGAALVEEVRGDLRTVVLENPLYIDIAERLKADPPEFYIGSAQDRAMVLGLDLAHLSLSGFYFWNNWSFIPYPVVGYRGSLHLLTHVARTLNEAYTEKDKLKRGSYFARDEDNKGMQSGSP